MASPDDLQVLARKPVQCQNLQDDRDLGAYWEREFCKLAAKHGRSFTAHQIGRPKSAQSYFIQGGKYHHMTLPDITVWTRPGEHHEIKHKDATAWGAYGLERYRVDALLWFAEETGQSVYYTIHDYSLQNAPTREAQKRMPQSVPDHWLTCSIVELADSIAGIDDREGASWVNGTKRIVPICYFNKRLFQQVSWLWLGEPQRDMFGTLVSVQAPPL